MKSSVNNVVYMRSYFRIFKWVTLIAFSMQILIGTNKIISKFHSFKSPGTIGSLLDVIIGLAFLFYGTSYFWFGWGSPKMEIECIDGTITLITRNGDKRSINVNDIDSNKSTWKHGVAKLRKVSAPFNDSINIIPDSIEDNDLRNIIVKIINEKIA